MGTVPPPPAQTSFVLRLQQQADLSPMRAIPRGPERREAVWAELNRVATESQGPILARLEQLRRNGTIRSAQGIALTNSILVDVPTAGHEAFRAALRDLPLAGVSQLAPNTGYDDRPHSDERFPLAAKGGTPWNMQQIGVPAARAQGLDGTGVRIGMIDSGVDVTHPVLQHAGEKILRMDLMHPGKPQPGRHGTVVAGFLIGDAPGYPIGVAPKATLVTVNNQTRYPDVAPPGVGGHHANALRAFELLLAPEIAPGIRDARAGVDLINNSWSYTSPPDGEVAASLRLALDQLRHAGITSIFSSGNTGKVGAVGAPGRWPGVLSIGASTQDDTVAELSNRGPVTPGPSEAPLIKPDLVAPGYEVPGAHTQHTVRINSGTSESAPTVTGAAALILQKYPHLEPEQLMDILRRSSVDIDQPGPDNNAGFGRLSIPAALDLAATVAG